MSTGLKYLPSLVLVQQAGSHSSDVGTGTDEEQNHR